MASELQVELSIKFMNEIYLLGLSNSHL